jgi:hypothetical protein
MVATGHVLPSMRGTSVVHATDSLVGVRRQASGVRIGNRRALGRHRRAGSPCSGNRSGRAKVVTSTRAPSSIPRTVSVNAE